MRCMVTGAQAHQMCTELVVENSLLPFRLYGLLHNKYVDNMNVDYLPHSSLACIKDAYWFESDAY